MNPLSLLTKGRTLKGLAKKGVYKLPPREGLLPHFGGVKRQPFAPAAQPAPSQTQASLFEQPLPPVQAVPAAPAAPAPAPVETPRPVLTPVLAPAPMGLPREGFLRRAVTFGKDSLERFIHGRKRRTVLGPTVQAELALEKLQVIRNDLNEDDLEVVLVEKKVGANEKPLARLSKVEMPGEAWTKLTSAFRKKNSERALQPQEKKEEPEWSAPLPH